MNHNSPSYIASQLGEWLHSQGKEYTHGKPYHPTTQGKIVRYHRSVKNQILLEDYYLPGELQARVAAFVDYYDQVRYHESSGTQMHREMVTSLGGGLSSTTAPESTKTIALRCKLHRTLAA